MKIPPTICSYRSMARQKARGHQPAMQPSEGCGVERLDAQNVPEHQRVCGYSDKGSPKNMKYVVTGVNKLTGEREPVTKPHSE